MEIALSIGVAVHNIDENTLRECLDSVVLHAKDGIEIIIVDDCSQNGADKICKEYENSERNIRFIGLEENVGISVVRNIIIEKASGKWLYYVDGDDILPDNFSDTAMSLTDADSDVILFESLRFVSELPQYSKKINPELIKLKSELNEEFSIACLSFRRLDYDKLKINNMNIGAIWSKAYNRKFLLDNHILFVPGQKKSQDTIFNTLVFYYAKKTAYYPEVMYYYRINPKSICNKYSGNYLDIMNTCIKHDFDNLEKLYNNREDIKQDILNLKLIIIAVDNMRLNIFHPDNSKKTAERKKEFLDFVTKEPFAEFLENFDYESYDWPERRIMLKLAKKKRFSTLDFMFKHPLTFKIYGGVSHRLKMLKSVKK